jgi:hypothetical protein
MICIIPPRITAKAQDEAAISGVAARGAVSRRKGCINSSMYYS